MSSSIQSKRLALFWQTRLDPLAKLAHDSPARGVFAAQILEGVGWLIEGVFCGAFDAGEADVVWTRLRPTVSEIEFPAETMVSPPVLGEVQRLLNSDDPFSHAKQMTEGRQKDFELPLFPHALLIADRLAADPLASMCTDSLYYVPEAQWTTWKQAWASDVDAAAVVERLTADSGIEQKDSSSLLAGYLCLLKHMEASRRFFAYAKTRVSRGVDFDSFRQRMGAVNAWRVPLIHRQGRERFESLGVLMEYALRPILEKDPFNVHWSVFQDATKEYVRSVQQDWETEHCAAFLVFA